MPALRVQIPQVLSDAEKRQKYDLGGTAGFTGGDFNNFFGQRGTRGGVDPFDLFADSARFIYLLV